MTFDPDHALNPLKDLFSIGSFFKKEKAPVAVVPSSSVLAATLDSKDLAILCLGIALIFTTLAFVSIALARR